MAHLLNITFITLLCSFRLCTDFRPDNTAQTETSLSAWGFIHFAVCSQTMSVLSIGSHVWISTASNQCTLLTLLMKPESAVPVTSQPQQDGWPYCWTRRLFSVEKSTICCSCNERRALEGLCSRKLVYQQWKKKKKKVKTGGNIYRLITVTTLSPATE